MKCLSAHSFPFNCTPWSIYKVWTILMLKILQAHLLRAFVAKLKIYAIYALYPESFCGKNLAIRKVFAFCDSGLQFEEKKSNGWIVLLLLLVVVSLSKKII